MANRRIGVIEVERYFMGNSIKKLLAAGENDVASLPVIEYTQNNSGKK